MRSQLLPLLLAATAAPTTTLAFGNNINPRQPQDVSIQTNTDANNGFVPISTTTESTWHTVPSDRPVPTTTTTAAAVSTATVTATTTTTTKTSTAGAPRVTGVVGGAMGAVGVLVVGLAAGL